MMKDGKLHQTSVLLLLIWRSKLPEPPTHMCPTCDLLSRIFRNIYISDFSLSPLSSPVLKFSHPTPSTHTRHNTPRRPSLPLVYTIIIYTIGRAKGEWGRRAREKKRRRGGGSCCCGPPGPPTIEIIESMGGKTSYLRYPWIYRRGMVFPHVESSLSNFFYSVFFSYNRSYLIPTPHPPSSTIILVVLIILYEYRVVLSVWSFFFFSFFYLPTIFFFKCV